MDLTNSPGHLNRQFVAEDAATLRPATEMTPNDMNGPMNELVNIILAAQIVPNANDHTQVLAALQALFVGRSIYQEQETGHVAFFARSTAPSGYLKANGALVSRVTYANLFNAIGTTFGIGDGATTFALPDLRGEFLRGFDDARGVDAGRAFGSFQTDLMQGHHHQFNVATWQSAGGNKYPGIGGYASDIASGAPTSAVTSALSDGVNGAPRTGVETRPRNIAILACIKY